MCDAMDSFTERMLKRVEERRKVLDQKLAATHFQNKNSTEENTRSCPDRTPEMEQNVNEIQKCDEIKREESSCGEDRTALNSLNEKENEMPQSVLRSDAKRRLNKLGALYSGDINAVISSPVQQTEHAFNAELESPSKSSSHAAGLTRRLAALAETINQREDDLRHVSVKPLTPMKPKISNRPWRGGIREGGSIMTFSKPMVIPIDEKISKTDSKTKIMRQLPSPQKSVFLQERDTHTSTKSILLDKSVLEKLEAQGFARCESHSNLAFDYNKENKRSSRDSSPVKEIIKSYNQIEENSVEKNSSLLPSKAVAAPINLTKNGVLKKQTIPKEDERLPEKSKQRYGSPVRMGVGKPLLSPTKLKEGSNLVLPAMGVRQLLSPLSSGNQGFVLQKAALFEGNSNQTKMIKKDPAELPLSQRKALFEKNPGTAVLPKAPFALAVPPSMLQEKKQPIMLSTSKITSGVAPCRSENPSQDPKKETQKAVDNVVAKFKKSADSLETTTKQQVQKAIDERQKELDMLKNRWNQHKNMNESPVIPTPPALPTEFVSEAFKTLPHKQFKNSTQHVYQKTVTFSDETIINRFNYSTDDTLTTLSTEQDETFIQRSSREREYPGVKDMKKIKISPPKPGHLYPNLSDMETESDIPASDFDDYADGLEDERDRFETSTESSSMSEASFGREIMRTARKSLSDSTLPTLKRDLCLTSSTNSDMSEESMIETDMNEFLDEALSDSDNEPTPPKRSRCSDSYDQSLNTSHSQSFEYSQGGNYTTSKISSGHLPAFVVDGDSELPLTYSVSFYRKQTMNREPLSPKRQFIHHSYREESEEESSDEDICRQQEMVEERIGELQQDVSRQQTIISQTSQALNLCNSTIEFSGSTEEVEGEKLLLIATQRRQVALHEIQRLKVEGTLRPLGPENLRLTEKGDLTLSNITLPLKLDNIRAAAREEKCYYLLSLIKSGHQVLSTAMKEALPRNLHSNNKLKLPSNSPLTLHDLYSDFKVTVEVYGISSCSKEVLPHDVKYHITTSKKDTCRLKLTPKKHKHDDKLFCPNLQSPGGPAAVRSPKFVLMGYVVFSLREINRNHFTLNKVPYTSVLEGSIELELSCQMTVDVEHRGFLTMFEDIAGTGAWHRRWCFLKGDTLSYWKYPDDENKKIPIDTVDLTTCITEQVEVASRDICARPNSFLLETSRPSLPQDEPSLTLIKRANQTIIRHLWSADTKDDRIKWCDNLNKALALLRAWGKK